MQLDFADACLIGLADEFGTADIFTLDQDFAINRCGKNKPFECSAEQGLAAEH